MERFQEDRSPALYIPCQKAGWGIVTNWPGSVSDHNGVFDPVAKATGSASGDPMVIACFL